MLSRRVIFGLLTIAVVAVLLIGPDWPVAISSSTRRVFDTIESLDSGAVVMISFDHEASSLPEVGPLGAAIADHCFQRGIAVVGLALFAEGNAAGYELLSQRAQIAQRTYGDDWVYLGYRPQYTAAILGMGESLGEVFATDYRGDSLGHWPLLRRVRNYDDVDLVVSVADGSMATYWVEYAGARYGVKIATALSAVMVTSYVPYLEAGQLAGIVAGFRGAAEYERLLESPGVGSRGMAAQTVAHGLIAVLVIIGNIELWRRKRADHAGR